MLRTMTHPPLLALLRRPGLATDLREKSRPGARGQLCELVLTLHPIDPAGHGVRVRSSLAEPVATHRRTRGRPGRPGRAATPPEVRGRSLGLKALRALSDSPAGRQGGSRAKR